MHDLLEPLAPEVDVDAAWAEVQARFGRPASGRAARALAIAAALALVAGGIALATRAGRGGVDEVPTGPTELPAVDGEVIDGPHDLHLLLPEGWQATDATLATGGFEQLAALATYPTPATPLEGWPCDGYPTAALADLGPTDAFVWLSREEGDFNLPPHRQLTELPGPGDLEGELLDCVGRPVDFDHTSIEFDDGGIDVAAFVALGSDATAATRAEALAVLNSIQVGEATELFTPSGSELGVQLPDGWQGTDRLVDAVDPPAGTPRQVAAFATFGIHAYEVCGGVGGECPPGCWTWPVGTVSLLSAGERGGEPAGALLWIDESFDFDLPHHDPRDPLYAELPSEPASGCDSSGVDVRKRTFDDHGRRLTTYVAFGPDATEQTRTEALAILNSITVD